MNTAIFINTLRFQFADRVGVDQPSRSAPVFK